jgi:hypothetical protein
MKYPYLCVGWHARELTCAYRLLWKYGLTDWECDVASLEWNVQGDCDFTRKMIRLDHSHVYWRPRRVVRETILHEIAHALVGRKPKPHGIRWQRKARELGVSERDINFHAAL